MRVRVADEEYALSVADVLEVCDLGEITRVPGASALSWASRTCEARWWRWPI